MKKVIILVLTFVNVSYFCSAQQDETRNRAEKIQATYITNQLQLSPEESRKFWPVYNNYREEIKTARLQKRDDELAFEEKVLGIRKKYKPEFKKILIDDQRVNKVFLVDKNFREILRRELQNRRKSNPPNTIKRRT